MSTSMAQREKLALKIQEAANARDFQPCVSLVHDAQAQAEALEALTRWQTRKGPLVSVAKVYAQRQRVERTLARRATAGG